MSLEKYVQHNDKDFNFVVNKKFNTRVNITSRKKNVAASFGLGIDESKEFTIYDDLRISFNTGDRIFITGDSGGGKSLLLNELRTKLEEQKFTTVSIENLNISPEEEIIEEIGDSLEQAIYYLSLVGLNDAFIFLRKYGELSDGQKYRYKVAKLLSQEPDAIFIDEFCANLDRTTAKVISYNLQRLNRKKNFLLVVATTHDDIIEDFNPNVLVTKHFMDSTKITYQDTDLKNISFYDDVHIEKGSFEDYKKLAKFHYKNTAEKFPYSKIFTAKKDKELVGVAVYSPPFLQTKGRTLKFGSKYTKMTTENVKEINDLFIRCSRVVLNPKYRGCGLGKRMVSDTMSMITDKKYIELINLMGKYNPFAEAAGMEKIEITEETDGPTIKLDKWLRENIEIDEIHNPQYFRNWVENLSDEDKNKLKIMTGKVLHHPKIGMYGKEGKRAEVVRQEKRYEEVDFDEVKEEILVHLPKLYSGMTLYYIWENPNYVESSKLK